MKIQISHTSFKHLKPHPKRNQIKLKKFASGKPSGLIAGG
jgi:hypothetical protein